MNPVFAPSPDDSPSTLAAKEYISENDWHIVPLLDGEKRPALDNWTANTLHQQVTSFPTDLRGIGLAHALSGTCAFDIDDLTAASAHLGEHGVDVEALLSAPNALKLLSGRENRAKLIYRLPHEIGPIQIVKKDRLGFELRCASKKGTSMQDVLPPSIHPSTGRAYSWIGDWRKVPIIPDELLRYWLDCLQRAESAEPWDPIDTDKYMPFIKSALASIDPDIEYGPWLEIGMALHSAGLGDMWEEWSEGSPKYKPGDCCGRLVGFEPDAGITMASMFHYAKESGWNAADDWEASIDSLIGMPPDPNKTAGAIRREEFKQLVFLNRICQPSKTDLADAIKRFARKHKVPAASVREDLNITVRKATQTLDMSHHAIAMNYLEGIKEHVSTEGSLWHYQETHWVEKPFDEIVSEIGRAYDQQKLCRTATNYRGVAGLVIGHNEKPDWFGKAERGVATLGGFYTFNSEKKLVKKPLVPEARIRHLIAYEPNNECPNENFQKLLKAISEDSRILLQEFLGAALFGTTTDYQRSMLLYGESGAGKSVLIRVLDALFDKTTEVAPGDFPNEYYRAALAGSELNSYTELPDDTAIDSAEFKAIVAGDRISARHIREAPFFFRPKAAHIFSSNKLPFIRSPEPAFWRRWLITEWKKGHSEDNDDRDLAKNIIANELPYVLYWGIEGARRLVTNGDYTLGNTHQATIADWSRNHNVVLTCLNAEDSPFIIQTKEQQAEQEIKVKAGEFTRAVKRWALENGYGRVSSHVISPLAKDALQSATTGGTLYYIGIGLAFDRPND